MAVVVIAPDSFKGSLPASEVARAIARGWSEVRPDDTLLHAPLADGGEGTLDAVLEAHPEAMVAHAVVTGPSGRPVDARWLMLSDQTAVVELAESSGLPLMVSPDPLGATTRGLGELIGHALDAGASRIMVALGGSASNDAGLGALEALGLHVTRDDEGAPGALGVTGLDANHLRLAPPGGIVLLVDTRHRLLEAPSVFGPQKGATPEQVRLLEDAFHALVDLRPGSLAHQLDGSGAAGGTAWGFAEFVKATITPGASVVAELLGLPEKIAGADLVISGEGRFDQTSHSGKVVGFLTELAGHSGVPGIIIAGSAGHASESSWPVYQLLDRVDNVDQAMTNASSLIEAAAREAAEDFA